MLEKGEKGKKASLNENKKGVPVLTETYINTSMQTSG